MNSPVCNNVCTWMYALVTLGVQYLSLTAFVFVHLKGAKAAEPITPQLTQGPSATEP